jgi:hypothetical protein
MLFAMSQKVGLTVHSMSRVPFLEPQNAAGASLSNRR